MLNAAIELCRPGDVLVVAVDGDCTGAMVGELMAVWLRARGLAGIVVDAGCRDIEAILAMGFPVFCRAISAQGVGKERLVPYVSNPARFWQDFEPEKSVHK